MIVRAAALLALLTLLRAAAPARAEAPRVAATRTSQAPTIDGHLGDAGWGAAIAEAAFVQKSPRSGAAPSETTTMRVLYDDDALYVAFDCEQRQVPVVARLARRDRPVESDSVSISIDTRRDSTTAFEFSVNAAGSLTDAIRFDDTEISTDWDEVWEARTQRTARGWSAELRIPLHVLRFDPVEDQEWGLQARRYISMRQETIEWSLIPLTAAGEVSRYGRLAHLQKLATGRRLELRPFVVARGGWTDLAADQELEGELAGGLDLRVHVTQNLTLDAAFLPDFAQAESDPSILNLATTEQQFPETRAFFIAGFDVFQTPLPLLYSRRIGLAPPTPTVGDDELATPPEPTTIYAAAKLAGTLGPRVTVGALAAVTGRNDVAVQPVAGPGAGEALAAPLTAQEALRVRIALSKTATLGGFASAVSRFEPVSEYPVIIGEGPAAVRCPDGAIQPRGERCFHDAYVAGLDGRWRSATGSYAASGQAVVSAIADGPPRQMLDGTVIAAGDVGSGGKLELAKEGGDVLADIAIDARSRRLDFNDLGFMDRQNHIYTTATVAYRMLEPLDHVLETRLSVSLFDHRDLDLLNLLRGYTLRSDWKLDSFWTFAAEVYFVPRFMDDRQIGTGAAIERDRQLGLDLHLTSDPRRWISIGVDTETQRREGGLYATFVGRVIAHVLPQLELELAPELIYATGEPRYVDRGATPDELVFGEQAARSLSTTVRASYTFTPRLSLQLYSQLFLAAEHYTQFTSYQVQPGMPRPRIRLGELTATGTPAANPDTELTSLQVNAVLRWEPLPGSTLFLVFTRGQAYEPGLSPGERGRLRLSALRDSPGLNALLLKFVYWLG